jgi:hypothetical protein
MNVLEGIYLRNVMNELMLERICLRNVLKGYDGEGSVVA